MTIIIRSYKSGYLAIYGKSNNFWAEGKTKEEAIGKLIIDHNIVMGINIEEEK